MKLATLKNDTLDGRLVVVSRDLERATEASAIAPNLLAALQDWSRCEPLLRQLYQALNAGQAQDAFDFDPAQAAAPLPRAPQWCDASAFLNHGRLMEKAFNTDPIPDMDTIPVMYQGASDDFLGASEDIPLPDEAHGIDFEGEFGVIVQQVPMACPPELALRRIALVVQINDVSLRGFGPREMRTGFGFLHAKPSSSFAPVAVTPDELGPAWEDARVKLPLHIDYNGQWFGHPNGAEMNFGFDRLIAHAALTRKLSAGTVIGSGTVSNADRAAGSACIAERRAIELIEKGKSTTPFMHFGDRVRMQATAADGSAPFGVIDQRIVKAPAPTV
ncbi:fumarylacetoacetate hydrolase family protein [Pusillimonas noertemannii]|uniref:Fumarylacetoacetate (FAA) hydrolase n=1 Tax=Pusillimonas noertemannii TaxID=305977 RepID=A0A2U1CPD4_9BURK|nr:fumarylacetoacetate hydrolase family protein [Pusillimonas noertemannii]NYT67084.1 fumarylacetoacetate hydrolase family protein [Pusillimonas noertemannii]PVY67758.1 fumarylacetoacetate (FAA) hydrolase [Pusillimonas noertemannii]TFL12710.1 FAA hydrolase family protein [Pusillimonas noertemannii]